MKCLQAFEFCSSKAKTPKMRTAAPMSQTSKNPHVANMFQKTNNEALLIPISLETC